MRRTMTRLAVVILPVLAVIEHGHKWIAIS
jgi:hypothetical protein